MASWGEHRSGRHLSIQVPAEIKIQLIKNKALTGVGIGYQICEALRAKWQGLGSPPAVIPGPCQVTHSIVPDRYAGMRQQKIDKTNMPWKI
jgi:hypothetical protein